MFTTLPKGKTTDLNLLNNKLITNSTEKKTKNNRFWANSNSFIEQWNVQLTDMYL